MNFIQRHRRPVTATLLAAFIAATVALLPHAARADFSGFVTGILSNIAYTLVQFLANVLVVVINIMVAVAQYNNFIAAPAVERGWVIVRDVSNMFFIMVLLIIAFGTILRLENYRYNRLLARLIIMAVLVNFSKFICGFFIDVAQVIMLTFVNAWREVAAGNITQALGLKDLVTLSQSQVDFSSTVQVDQGAVLSAVILALILILIAVVVMTIIALVLIMRILALWFLVVLSPLAYLLRTYPSGEKYASRWWQEFGKYVITGPIVAFLLWLSLAMMASPQNEQLSFQVFNTQKEKDRGEVTSVVGTGLTGAVSGAAAGNIAAAITAIGNSENLLRYIIGIMLLIGTLVITKELGVAGGQLAGQAAEKIKSVATKAAIIGGAGAAFGGWGVAAAIGGKKTIQLAGTGLKKGAGFGGRKLDEWNVRAQGGEGPLAGIYRNVLPKGLRHYLEERPVSLRPSYLKKAYEEYRTRREHGIYGTVGSGMADTMNRVMSGGKFKSNLVEIAHNSEVSKARGELVAGGSRKEQLLEQAASNIEFDEDEKGNVSNVSIRAGRKPFVEGALMASIPSHDINEFLKHPVFGRIVRATYTKEELDRDPTVATKVNGENLMRLMKALLGSSRAASAGLRFGELGQSNSDSWLMALSDVDSHGMPAPVSQHDWAEKNLGKNFDEMTLYDPAVHDPQGLGRDWREASEDMTKDQRKGYKDYVRDETDKQRAEIIKNYVIKRTNRQLAQGDRRQDNNTELALNHGRYLMLYPETIEHQFQMIYKQPQLKDFKYENPETKQDYYETHAIRLAYADMASSDPGIRQRAIDTYHQLGVTLPRVLPNEEQRMGLMRFIADSMEKASGKGNFDEAAGEGTSADDLSNALAATIRTFHMDADYDRYKAQLIKLVKSRYQEFWKKDITPEQVDNLIGQLSKQAAIDVGLPEVPQLGTPTSALEFNPKNHPVSAGVEEIVPARGGRAPLPVTAPVGIPAPATQAPGAGSAPAGPAPAAGSPLMDVDSQRYQETKERAENFPANLGGQAAFFNSAEYRNNQDKYLDEESYNQAAELEKRPISPIGGIAAFGRSEDPSNMLAFDGRSFAGGKFSDRAGHNLTDPKDIRDFLGEYDALLQQEYEKLEEKAVKTDGEKIRMQHLEAARQRINSALAGNDAGLSNLQIVNSARAGYSGRHVAAHEDTHAKLDAMDPDRSFRRKILGETSSENRQAMVTAMRDKTGNQQMNEEEAFDEYLTEGIVNSWRSWADASPDAINIDPQMMEDIQDQAERVARKRAEDAGASTEEIEAAAQKSRFLTSKNIPELEDAASSPGVLQRTFGALGYKAAGGARDTLRFVGKQSGAAARGMGGLAKVSARWTGKQMAKGITSVFGTTLGQSINEAFAKSSQRVGKAGQKVGSIAVKAGQATVGAGQTAAGGLQRGIGAASAVVAIGAQRTRDSLQNFQISLEKRKRDKVEKLEEDARTKMEALRVKKEQRRQQEKATPNSRAYWNQQDAQYDKQVKDLNVQRDQAVRGGKLGDTISLSQKIKDVEKQRTLARQRQGQGNQLLEQAKVEEAAAKAAAEQAIDKATAERAKVFGPKLQTPAQLKSGLNPEQYSQLDRAVNEAATLQKKYEQASETAATKRQSFLGAKDSATPEEYNALYRDMAGASGEAKNLGRAFDIAQDNLERLTQKLTAQFATTPVGQPQANAARVTGFQTARATLEPLQSQLVAAQGDLAYYRDQATRKPEIYRPAEDARKEYRQANDDLALDQKVVSDLQGRVDRGELDDRPDSKADALGFIGMLKARIAPKAERSEAAKKNLAEQETVERSRSKVVATEGKVQELTAAVEAAQKKLQEETTRLSQSSYRGPTVERRTVTEEVKEVRAEAPTTRTERVVEEREAPPTQRTERVVEERKPDDQELAGGTGASGVVSDEVFDRIQLALDRLVEGQQHTADIMNATFSHAVDGLSKNIESALGEVGKRDPDLARQLQNRYDSVRTNNTGNSIIEQDWDKRRTTELLRELVHEIKGQGRQAADKAPERGPGGENID